MAAVTAPTGFCLMLRQQPRGRTAGTRVGRGRGGGALQALQRPWGFVGTNLHIYVLDVYHVAQHPRLLAARSAAGMQMKTALGTYIRCTT